MLTIHVCFIACVNCLCMTGKAIKKLIRSIEKNALIAQRVVFCIN